MGAPKQQQTGYLSVMELFCMSIMVLPTHGMHSTKSEFYCMQTKNILKSFKKSKWAPFSKEDAGHSTANKCWLQSEPPFHTWVCVYLGIFNKNAGFLLDFALFPFNFYYIDGCTIRVSQVMEADTHTRRTVVGGHLLDHS